MAVSVYWQNWSMHQATEDEETRWNIPEANISMWSDPVDFFPKILIPIVETSRISIPIELLDVASKKNINNNNSNCWEMIHLISLSIYIYLNKPLLFVLIYVYHKIVLLEYWYICCLRQKVDIKRKKRILKLCCTPKNKSKCSR
jgi:hypothetical protein